MNCIHLLTSVFISERFYAYIHLKQNFMRNFEEIEFMLCLDFVAQNFGWVREYSFKSCRSYWKKNFNFSIKQLKRIGNFHGIHIQFLTSPSVLKRQHLFGRLVLFYGYYRFLKFLNFLVIIRKTLFRGLYYQSLKL